METIFLTSFFIHLPPAKRLQTSRFVVDELGHKLRNKGISHLFGAHIYRCLRQCGFNDDTTCVSSHCEEQSGEKHYRRCLVINPPTSLDATSNHVHLLIYCNKAPQSGTFAMSACETQASIGHLRGLFKQSESFLENICVRSVSVVPG